MKSFLIGLSLTIVGCIAAWAIFWVAWAITHGVFSMTSDSFWAIFLGVLVCMMLLQVLVFATTYAKARRMGCTRRQSVEDACRAVAGR